MRMPEKGRNKNNNINNHNNNSDNPLTSRRSGGGKNVTVQKKNMHVWRIVKVTSK